MPYTAYGAEPHRRATYELRQSRYQALGEDVAREAERLHARDGRRCKLLDVGVFDGVSRRYIETHRGAEHIDFEAVDIFPYGHEFVYKHAQWKLHHINLLEGMPTLPSNHYDVVVCEQVLEHLHNVQPALHDLVRVLKPGGLLIVGVPIFPDGVHLVRKHLVPRLDRWLGVKKIRGHVQAWSLRTLMREFRALPDLQLECRRGFRIVSGGILRPLEFTRTWWRMNRALGKIVPGLCTEVQLLARKHGRAPTASTKFVRVAA